MIIKERDPKIVKNKFEVAGEKAEEQMIYYLKRSFGDQENRDVIVLNDLRIVDNHGMSAQMDHLVIHQYGFVIIESKSVHGEVAINDSGEWVRIYNRQKKGMRSPIKQAQMQRDILIKVLEENKSKLFRDTIANKVFKTNFHKFFYEEIVAISDTGIIRRPKEYDTSMVMKADMVCDYIDELIKKYVKKRNILSLSIDIPPAFHPTTMMVIAEFLRSKHQPVELSNNGKVEEKPVSYGQKVASNTKTNIEVVNKLYCDKCKSQKVNIVWGKYGYYLKCQECNGNTKLSLKCKDQNCKVKLRKEKNHFYKVCETCKIEELFYINQ